MIGINFQKSEVKEKYTSNISKFFNSLYLMNRGKMKPLFMGVLLVFITSCASETEYVEEVLQDCEDCPELVLIAAGKFLMGAHRNDEQVTKWEHEASVTEISNDYYIGKYEITYAQFMKCVEESSCQYIPVNLYDECKKGIFCRVDYREEKVDVNRLPVTGISFYDAIEYTRWISQKTGHKYTLPTEEQWEYAARGGTNYIYWWGDDFEDSRALCAGCMRGYVTEEIPFHVGSFDPNPFGLHDMLGNTAELVDSCYSIGVLNDEIPSRNKDCEAVPLRGGRGPLVNMQQEFHTEVKWL
ncbi:MAG: SUMF1/EgtB/PvdO family nonheme iron enzyme [Kordiimonadaceae bacterium]|jgi:formylglycine-generating enzyme required for sulfatase activity|nr:SUMF1/EgtB/PvdO family nonheme iron enzyme [Kordiimonadaceae bacterium]MBT6032590.1 SUMF1/EgtB/PvdO family nonheme iron enzyme [Kordiimonadaceae bacterium]